MKFIIDVPDEMIQCVADEGIEICLDEQIYAMFEEIDERLIIAEETIKMAEEEGCYA